ncbi:hypothetical protein T492DRAFT_889202 [Pavlovales sp. CCMP2436]|nr:hypothetical protein T492DRAFT_889202 [Pavlovales sp. CCMP2436]
MKTLALGLIYAPAMPIIWFVTAGTIVVKYWATKYALLRVCRQPPTLDEGLSEVFRELLSYLLIGSVILEGVVLDSRLGDETTDTGRLNIGILSGSCLA